MGGGGWIGERDRVPEVVRRKTNFHTQAEEYINKQFDQMGHYKADPSASAAACRDYTTSKQEPVPADNCIITKQFKSDLEVHTSQTGHDLVQQTPTNTFLSRFKSQLNLWSVK